MKHFACLSVTGLALAACATAAPLRKTEVAADAKWVLHLDADQMRSTSTGNFLVTEVADKLLADPKAEIKRETGIDLDLNKISSITAYGDYTNHVLLLKADIDAEKVLDAFLAKMKSEGKSEPSSAVKTTEDGLVTYSIKDHVFLTIRPDKIIIAGQTLEANRRANEVLAGKSPNLSSSTAFTAFPETHKAFFFLGAAEGFNPAELPSGAAANNGNNPKAKILKMADGGRLVVGQDADQLFADVSLKAKSPTVVKQMQQIIQGMIALGSLAQPDNTNLQQLAESAKVDRAGDVVTLSLNFPADSAMQFLKSNALEHDEHHHHEGGQRQGTNAPAK
jgi:hypothetical protein